MLDGTQCHCQRGPRTLRRAGLQQNDGRGDCGKGEHLAAHVFRYFSSKDEIVVFATTARRSMQIADEHLEVKAAQLSRLHRIESRVAAEFGRALRLRDPHHPRATALAATTLMLVDVALRTWYRDGLVPLKRIVDALIDAVGLLGAGRPPAVRRCVPVVRSDSSRRCRLRV
jgi:hypothetical protein